MPELPEVEVVRSTLEAQLVGRRIERLECFYTPIVEEDFKNFEQTVIHQKIMKMGRYAKYLIFHLEKGTILSHLRMEGKYYFQKEEEELPKYVHLIFHLDGGYKLSYGDMRKFGRLTYRSEADLFVKPPLSNVGVEANSDKFDLEDLYAKIHRKNLPIKSILLDQRILSGLGNIYVDEVLFQAHVYPLKKGNQLTKEELTKILEASRSILTMAIQYKGTTIRSYTSSLGVRGNFQDHLCVHTKTICPVCHSILTKLKIGGRTSYFCEKCQG